MDIEEIDALIEEAEGEMERARAEIAKIRRNRATPANQKDSKCAPFLEAQTQLRLWCAFLIHQKDQKIPFYEKLPKSSEFYRHHVQNQRHKRLHEAARGKAEEDRMKFESASEKIDYERERSRNCDSPESTYTRSKRVLYE